MQITDGIYRMGTPVKDKETLEAIAFLEENLPYGETLASCWRRLAREEAAKLEAEMKRIAKRAAR